MTTPLTVDEAVQQLDALAAQLPNVDTGWKQRLTSIGIEEAHIEADRILLETVDPRVVNAYERVVEAAGDWWYA